VGSGSVCLCCCVVSWPCQAGCAGLVIACFGFSDLDSEEGTNMELSWLSFFCTARVQIKTKHWHWHKKKKKKKKGPVHVIVAFICTLHAATNERRGCGACGYGSARLRPPPPLRTHGLNENLLTDCPPHPCPALRLRSRPLLQLSNRPKPNLP
jgi:hypothetical protein